MLVGNISDNLTSILFQRSLDTMNISSIIRSFTCNDLYFKEALSLFLKPLNFAFALIPQTEWVDFPWMFSANIPVTPNKRSLGFSKFFFLAIEEQDFGCSVITYLYQMGFTCASTFWKESYNLA